MTKNVKKKELIIPDDWKANWAEGEPLVNLRNCHKSFGDTEVLKDISVSVNRGEVVAVIGPSGGGKSTLLRCMTLLETMDGGSLQYEDIIVCRPDTAQKTVYG
ncbi:MAG: amino acid ABC transporter ATP-binding protein, partial [Eggerthellaceae bacterium]|nr:amino acid ABC transporter ATP-binding protein [Eggerthellaceae bacterium]